MDATNEEIITALRDIVFDDRTADSLADFVKAERLCDAGAFLSNRLRDSIKQARQEKTA
jgi:hypothetical protein